MNEHEAWASVIEARLFARLLEDKAIVDQPEMDEINALKANIHRLTERVEYLEAFAEAVDRFFRANGEKPPTPEASPPS